MTMSKKEKAKKQHERYLKLKASGMTKIYSKRSRSKPEVRIKRNVATKAWHKRNKEHDKLYARELYKTPKRKAQYAIWQKKYSEANKEKIAIYRKQYRKLNKEKLKIQKDIYYQANKEIFVAKSKAYAKTQAGKIAGKRSRIKLRATLHGRLRHNVSNAVRLKLLNHNGKKNWAKIDKILPFKISDLIKRLEFMFKPGMTWDNYGEWHLDHVVADSKFNYTTSDCPDFKKSWALKNLQPLWAHENMIKGNR